MMVLFIVVFGLAPPAAAVLFARRYRGALRRPGIYTAAGIAAGYALAVLLAGWVAYPLTQIGLSGVTPHGEPTSVLSILGTRILLGMVALVAALIAELVLLRRIFSPVSEPRM